MEAYLMIMHELEKARLASQVRKDNQKEEFSSTGSHDGTAQWQTNPKEAMK